MAVDANKHILIVDDDEILRSYLKELLLLENFKVSEAENGKAGLKQARTVLPDLIITDIIMPEMEGISFIRELRTFNKETPIIVMTGNTHGRMDEYLGISEQVGADAILRKPVEADDLLAAINTLLK